MKFEEWWTEEREDMAHSGCGQAILGEREHWKHVVHSAYKLGFEEGSQPNPQTPSEVE